MPAAAVRAVRGCSLLRRNFPSILVVPMLLKNQIALITGSGRGIGRAIAQLFAKQGAAVFLAARTAKELAAVAKEISGRDRKSTRLNSSHPSISYAVFCLKKKKKKQKK